VIEQRGIVQFSPLLDIFFAADSRTMDIDLNGAFLVRARGGAPDDHARSGKHQ